MNEIVIIASKRTPLGSFQGCLSSLESTDLGSIAIKGSLKDLPITPDQVYMGCVLQAGLGQSPARQASIKAGLNTSIPATTINKVCGSGMQAIACGYESIFSGNSKCVIAGGMESMSNAPYLLPKARSGYRLGHNKVIDHMFIDGLEDAYSKGSSMGSFAEKTAEKYSFTREEQDTFAKNSVIKANEAIKKGYLQKECEKIEIKTRKDTAIIDTDEIPGKINIDKIPLLKPAFKEGGTITAASSSSISDGAAAIVMMDKNNAEKLGIKPIAKIISYATFSHAPDLFTVAPIGSIKKVLEKSNWDIADVDIFEINEAFAVVTMAAIKELNINPEKVNIFGGACALGHPIGASGARIVTTLINALQIQNKKRGLASLCIGGGEAIAMTLELI